MTHFEQSFLERIGSSAARRSHERYFQRRTMRAVKLLLLSIDGMPVARGNLAARQIQGKSKSGVAGMRFVLGFVKDRGSESMQEIMEFRPASTIGEVSVILQTTPVNFPSGVFNTFWREAIDTLATKFNFHIATYRELRDDSRVGRKRVLGEQSEDERYEDRLDWADDEESWVGTRTSLNPYQLQIALSDLLGQIHDPERDDGDFVPMISMTEEEGEYVQDMAENNGVAFWNYFMDLFEKGLSVDKEQNE